MRDVWGMFQVILEERKRREVDPTIAVLRDSVAVLEKGADKDPAVRHRLAELLDFMETMDGAYRELRGLSMEQVRRFLKLRGGLRRVVALISR